MCTTNLIWDFGMGSCIPTGNETYRIDTINSHFSILEFYVFLHGIRWINWEGPRFEWYPADANRGATLCTPYSCTGPLWNSAAGTRSWFVCWTIGLWRWLSQLTNTGFVTATLRQGIVHNRNYNASYSWINFAGHLHYVGNTLLFISINTINKDRTKVEAIPVGKWIMKLLI